MKKYIFSALIATFIVFYLSGCVAVNFSVMESGIGGKGTPESYSYKVGEYNKIRAEIFCDIEYYSAPSDTVTIEIQPNLAEYIKIEAVNGILTISSQKRFNYNNSSMPVLKVSTPNLSRLELNGAGVFTTYDTIKSESFVLNINGAVQGKADLDVDNLTVEMDGAGDFEFSGRAGKSNLIMAGAGKIDAISLLTSETSIDFSGMGSVRVNCSDRLNVYAGGMGSIEYMGSPELDIEKDGMVSIRKLD